MFQHSSSNNNDLIVIPIQQDHNNHVHSHNDHLWNIPSHLLDDDDIFLSTMLPYQPQTPTNSLPPPSPPPPPPPPPNMEEEDPPEKGQRKPARGPSKRKPRKKDRHSKIHTAHGPRDRRMRLSLQIARKFFDLQDMLGFDKASKTIEWLFNKSKSAIKDLAEKGSCATTLALSPSEDTTICDGGDGVCAGGANSSLEIILNKQKVGKKGALQTKENREKARARARKRTKEKSMMKRQGKNNSNNNEITLEDEQNPRNSRYVDEQLQIQHPLENQMAYVGITEKFLDSSPSFHHGTHHHQPCAQSSDHILQYSDLQFGSDWLQEDVRMSEYLAVSNDLPAVRSPNFAIMNRPYNQGA